MKNRQLNYRYRSVMIFVLIIMAVIMSGINAMGMYSLLNSGNNEGASWILICYLVSAIVLIAACIFMYLTYESLMKKIFTSIDSIMETFPKTERDAIEEMSYGDDTVLLQKALEWFSYRQVQNDRMKFVNSTNSALISFSNEIFWEYGFLGNTLRYGDYWEKTYGDNTLFDCHSIDELLDEVSLKEFKNVIEEAKSTVGRSFSFNVKIKINRNKIIRARVIGTSTLAFDEVVLFGVVRDAEQAMSMNEAINEQQRMISYILGLTNDNVIYEVDRETNKLTFLNRGAAKKLFDFENLNDFEIGRRPYWDLIHEDYREGFIDRFFNYDHLLVLPEQRLSYDYQVKTTSDEWIWVRHSVYVVRAKEGHVKKVIGSIVNINEIKCLELKKMYPNNHDGITGALQMTVLKSEYNNFECRPNKAKAILLFDIDSFKHLNQQFSFETGNKILRALVTALWESQIGKCLVGRVEGDKFMMTMFEVDEQGEQTPERIVNNVFAVFKDCIKIDSQTINVVLSASYALDRDGRDFETVRNEAEIALRACKQKKSLGVSKMLAYSEQLKEKTDKDASASEIRK